MNNTKVEDALLTISEVLVDADQVWCIGGSGALLIHGVDVSPNDIDLIVDPSGRDEILALLRSSVDIQLRELANGKVALTIGGVTGEILEFSLNRNDLEIREYLGGKFLVNKLELEHDYYKRRKDKIESNRRKIVLIERELSKRKLEK